jgi:V8-like Glu-specific endopeptidase
MQWISGAFIYFCSGGLLADNVGGSQIPYFLTANHCISRGKDARNLETFFKLNDVTRDTVDCSNTPLTCDDWRAIRSNHPASLRTLGATIRATDRTSDYTLLELSQDAPGGTQFLGWDATPIATSDGTSLFRISHPSGAPQAYSEHEVDTSYGTCSSWPRGDWIYSRDTFGATEGGSSGSPVVNGMGEVVGQLSGACGTNVNNTCDYVRNATVDGAFAAYYADIAQILDPSPVQCTPTESPEVSCSDDVDNDCDGLVDALDSDCSIGSGFPAGAACEINSECASGKCKGKPGSKTCK